MPLLSLDPVILEGAHLLPPTSLFLFNKLPHHDVIVFPYLHNWSKYCWQNQKCTLAFLFETCTYNEYKLIKKEKIVLIFESHKTRCLPIL